MHISIHCFTDAQNYPKETSGENDAIPVWAELSPEYSSQPDKIVIHWSHMKHSPKPSP